MTPTLSPSELREIEGRAVTVWRQGDAHYVDHRIIGGSPMRHRDSEYVALPTADHALLCSALRAAWAEIARLGGEG